MTLVNHLTSDISLLTLQQLFHVVSISHTSYNPSRPSRCMPVYRCMPQQLRLIARLNSLEALSDQASGWFTLVDKFGTAYAEKLPNLHLVPSCSILFQLVPACSSLFQRVPRVCLDHFGSLRTFQDPFFTTLLS